MKKDFLFGVATSSLQIEGTNNSFKTIWDLPENNVQDKSNCIEACQFYQRYKADIKLIKELGVHVYRMSISWARVCPTKSGFSKSGIDFYHRVFKELKKNNILVDVTLYHWDMPLWLYESGIGFHSPKIVNYFLNYAKKMFLEFDQYVNNWVTINEPWCVSRVGYIYGTHAPFIVNDYQKAFMADYFMLLSHQEVYDFYKANYKKSIGIVLNVWGNQPLNNNSKDIFATENAHQFYEGVYLNPLFKGEFATRYLDLLRDFNIDTRFIDHKRLKEVKNKVDFLGINYYMHNTVTYDSKSNMVFKTVKTNYPRTDMDWEINPEGLRFVLTEIRNRYTDIPIYITENGSAFKDELNHGIIDDNDRIAYLKGHIQIIEEVNETLNIKGYYVWSLMDNFEWNFGYKKRFGIIYIDFNNFERIPKKSYYEYRKIIQERGNI